MNITPKTKLSESETPAAIRVLEFLELVVQEPGELSLSDVARKMGLSKSTVHRLADFLCEAGYLGREAGHRAFWIGPRLREFSLATMRNDFRRSAIRQVLRKLSAEVNETINIATLDGTEIIYLERLEARWPLRLSLDFNSRLPAHSCASGKLFLALIDSDHHDMVLRRLSLESLTAQTITTREQLATDLQKIRQRGYALDEEEFVEGMVAVAVPILNPEGRIRASLAIHAPTARCESAQALVQRVPLLRETANIIQQLMVD